MNTLYLNCTAGISGDMYAGALLDITGAFDDLREVIGALPLSGYELSLEPVTKKGVTAKQFRVAVTDDQPHRHYTDIVEMFRNAELDTETLRISLNIFRLLGEAEAAAHNTPIEHVHFHEVGAVDSIIDIVSAAWLTARIAPDRIAASYIPVGRGRIQYSHGETDLPVPAVRNLLQAIPTVQTNIPKELTTPTGAAILRALVHDFGDVEPLNASDIGVGSGERDLEIPNVLKVSLGGLISASPRMLMLETNIDDMSPELLSAAVTHLIKAGCADAWVEPCRMKKNRMGAVLKVLCDPSLRNRAVDLMFKQTTTFGIRVYTVTREVLERKVEEVITPFGPVRIKKGFRHGELCTQSPEFDDCEACADAAGVPVRTVYAKASALASDS